MAESKDMPDKKYLYGNYQESDDWRQRLHRKLAHKSLDIGMDDDVNVDNSRVGLGWKELAVIAGMLLGGTAIWKFGDKGVSQQPVVVPSVPQQQYSPPIDSEYEVRFYDKDGNPIEIPQISRAR